jgi:hypothetical protein
MCSAPTSTSCSRSRARRRTLSLLLLAVASTAFAEAPPLSVSPAGSDVLEAHTRQVVTVALLCGNTGSGRRTLRLEPELPPGWKALGAPATFSLEAAASDITIASFLVPPMAAAGEYVVRYRLRDVGEDSVTAECVAHVTVLPEISFGVKLLDAPAYVLAGDEYEASFVLENNGNVDVPVDIDILCGSSLLFHVKDLDRLDELLLHVASPLSFRIAVQTDGAMMQSTRHVLQVTVRLHTARDPTQFPPAIATSLVEVIPLSTSGEGLWHTLPVLSQTMAMIGFAPDFQAAFQQSFHAKGSLDERGEELIEVDVRKMLATGQDPLDNPQDKYSLWFRNRFLEVMLGDQMYSISPLLASDEYARGGEAVVYLSPVRFGALYFADAGSGGGAQGLGGFADVTLPRLGATDGILYQASLGVLAPLDDRILFSLWQQYNPLKDVWIQLDAALQRDATGTLSSALLALAQADTTSFSLMGRFLRAWPAFEGNYHDIQSLLATASAQLFDGRLGLQARFDLTDQNLLLDVSLPSADRTRLLFFSTNYTLPGKDTDISLSVESNRRKDRLPSPGYDGTEILARIAVHQPLEPFNVRLSTSLSRTHDVLIGSSAWVQRADLSVAYDPPDILQYLFTIQYTGRWSNGVMPNHSIGWSLNGGASSSATRLDARLNNEYSFSRTGLSSFSAGAGATFSHRFPWGHTLFATTDLAISYAAAEWSPGFILSATYGIPVDVPVSRRKDIAIVTGHVHHAITGERLANILLRLNGQAAVSDRNGAFTFYLANPGMKYLQVDRGSIPTNLIPAQRMPMAVETVAGSTITVDVSLVEGSAVAGTVAVFGFPDETTAFVHPSEEGEAPAPSPDRVRLGGLGNMIIELANGTETRRKLTGPDGRFDFTQVRPGHYTIRIIGSVPTYHEIEEPSREIDLAPSEARNVEFRVLQERRRIEVIMSGLSVVLEAPAVPQGGITVTLPGVVPDITAPAPVVEPAPVEPAVIAPPVVEPVPVEPAPTQPVEPAPAQPAQPAVAVQPAPGERHVAPNQPSHETLVMAAQAGFDAPAPTWQQILAAMQTQPVAPSGPPATAAAAAPAAAPQTAAPATTTPATIAPVSTAPATTTPSTTTPSTTTPKPPSTAPVTTAPATPAPATPAPAKPSPAPTVPVPTTPPITITIPLPMPTPKPPVIVPVPSPTPQPFWP